MNKPKTANNRIMILRANRYWKKLSRSLLPLDHELSLPISSMKAAMAQQIKVIIPILGKPISNTIPRNISNDRI